MSPSDLPESTRAAVLEVIGDLLHDWVKYMEMRLLSIDWDHPPDDVEIMLRRGIEQTRRFRSESRGVKELWAKGREQLAKLTQHEEIQGLVAALDRDVEALCELLVWDLDRLCNQAGEVSTRIRMPGDRLRACHDSLSA